MRELVLGVFLGVLLPILPKWMEEHKMDNYIDFVFFGLIIGIICLIAWRPILRLISKVFPRLYIWINELNATPPITDEYKRKAYHRKENK